MIQCESLKQYDVLHPYLNKQFEQNGCSKEAYRILLVRPSGLAIHSVKGTRNRVMVRVRSSVLQPSNEKSKKCKDILIQGYIPSSTSDCREIRLGTHA